MADMKEFLLSRKRLSFLFLLIALGVGIVIGTLVSDQVLSAEKDQNDVNLLSVQEAGAPLVSSTATDLAEGFGRVVKQVRPAVVNISTTAVIRSRQRTQRGAPDEDPRNFFGDKFWEKFFGPMGPQAPQDRKTNSLGSGVIVDAEGYILTNDHVVATVRNRDGGQQIADKIEVTLYNGETYVARVVGEDPESDLAVLKIDATNSLPFAKVGSTSKMQVGDWVLAIGDPFGVGQTVTSGIVSATGRVVPNSKIFGDYIQTDAAINPGNSGGPLVNMSGEIVGINSFIFTRSGGSQGVGFAIPSSVFVNSYNQIITKGKIERGWLGVSMNIYEMTPEMARYFGVSGDDSVGIKDGDGVLVTQLIDEKGEPGEDGPAYKAGVQPGDVIVEFDKREIETIHDLRSAVANTPPGEKQSVIVVRKGVIQDLSVVLAERTLEQQARSEGGGLSFEERREEERTKEIGLEFETLKQQDAEKMGLGDEQGVRILEVAVGSLADDAGLRAGQVITHVNGDPVQTAQDLYNGINSMSSNQGVILRIVWVNPQDSQRRKAIAYTSFIKP